MSSLRRGDAQTFPVGGTTFLLSPLPGPWQVIRSVGMPPASGARWTTGPASSVRLFARGTHALPPAWVRSFERRMPQPSRCGYPGTSAIRC